MYNFLFSSAYKTALLNVIPKSFMKLKDDDQWQSTGQDTTWSQDVLKTPAKCILREFLTHVNHKQISKTYKSKSTPKVGQLSLHF